MSVKQFVDLVRKMRAAQKSYYAANPKTDMERKMKLLIESKKLEKEVDNAEIDPQYVTLISDL